MKPTETTETEKDWSRIELTFEDTDYRLEGFDYLRTTAQRARKSFEQLGLAVEEVLDDVDGMFDQSGEIVGKERWIVKLTPSKELPLEEKTKILEKIKRWSGWTLGIKVQPKQYITGTLDQVSQPDAEVAASLFEVRVGEVLPGFIGTDTEGSPISPQVYWSQEFETDHGTLSLGIGEERLFRHILIDREGRSIAAIDCRSGKITEVF